MKTPLHIVRGKTFKRVVRWQTLPFTFAAIEGISASAPARVHAPTHGLPDGWRTAVVSVKGPTQINSERDDEGVPATFVKTSLVDADNVDLQNVNASEWPAYKSGGYLQYYTPVDLTGFTARMEIKDQVGGTALETLTTANSKIVIDQTAHTITLLLDAVATAAYTWDSGVYDLELVSAGGEVTGLLHGDVIVHAEVTTDP